MRTYELFLHIDPTLDESKCNSKLKEVENLIQKFEGKIVDMDKRGRQKLSYSIDKRQDSYQVLLKVEAKPDTLTQIERQLKLLDNVLRFGIFTNK